MSLGQYLLGVAGLVAIAASLGLAALRVRERILPGWTGAPARLAELVLALSALLVVAQLLGVVGLFNGIALVAASLLAAALAVAATRAGPAAAAAASSVVIGDREAAGPARTRRTPTAMTLVALAIAFVVVMHWSVAVQVNLDIGSYNGDDLVYHLPFSARFAEQGSITGLNFVSPSYLVWLYPANSELLHGAGMVLFDGDLSAPLLNLAWLGLALLAAWCFGARFGAGPQALAGTALLLDLPVLVASQAGTAKNDLLALAMLLAAAALLVQGAAGGEGAAGRRPGGAVVPAAIALAGLAAGIAAGAKFSLIPAVAVLAAGTVWLAVPGARIRAAALFGLPALATGGYWYARNLVHAGNPLPWVGSIGPIDLPGLDQSLNSPPAHSVAGYLFDGRIWDDWFVPGLSAQLGPLWPLILLLGGAGLVLGLLQRSGVVRVVAAAGVAAALFYLLQPNGAEGPEGEPVVFAFALRHLAAPLMLGTLVAASLAGAAGRRAGWATLGAFAILAAGFTRRGLDFWDSPEFLAGAVAIAAVVIALPAALIALPAIGPGGRRLALGLAIPAGAMIVAAGWLQADDYAESRYRTGFPDSYIEELQMDANGVALRPVYSWAQQQHDARIGTSAVLQYGLYDSELSNHVQFIGINGPDAAFDQTRTCGEWRDAVNRGDYDYVVTAPRYGGKRSPQTRWTESDPAATPVFRDGPVRVFRLGGPLNPVACPAGPD